MVGPSPTARNLGIILDDQLRCTANNTVVTRSCRFALYNIRRIRPFLPREAAQLLVQALVISCLNYCNSLLAGQGIQNTAARPLYNMPKFSHVTPLFRNLQWLPVAARIKFKTMELIYKAVNETAPTYLQALVRPHAPDRALRTTTLASRLVPPSLRASKGRTAKSQLFCLGAAMVERPPC